MERDYDLFERVPDNSPVWRGFAHGLENARRKLQELAKRTTNECFAIHTTARRGRGACCVWGNSGHVCSQAQDSANCGR